MFAKVKFFHLVIVLLLSSLILAGCARDENEEFIQGQWYDKDDHLANLPGESALELYWLFDDHYFEAYACCFTRSDFSGYYRIVSSEGDIMELELYNPKGYNGDFRFSSSDTLSLTIEIDRLAGTLEIGANGPFTRDRAVP